MHLLEAIRLHPDKGDSSLHCNYVRCLVQAKKWDDAFAHCTEHSAMLGDLQSQCLTEIGNHKFARDEYREALAMYTRTDLSRMEEADESLALNVAYCYQQLGEPQKSLKFYYRYLEWHPADAYTISNIAVLEYYSKHYSAALAMYKRMSGEQVSCKKLWFNMGVCHQQSGDLDEALSWLRRNLEGTKQNRDNCLLTMAWIHSKKRAEHDKAIELYRQLSPRIINSKDLEFDIASCYQQAQRYPEALKYYALYLRKQKDNINTLHNVAWIYINDDGRAGADGDEDEDEKRPRERPHYHKAKPLLLRILRIDKQYVSVCVCLCCPVYTNVCAAITGPTTRSVSFCATRTRSTRCLCSACGWLPGRRRASRSSWTSPRCTGCCTRRTRPRRTTSRPSRSTRRTPSRSWSMRTFVP